MPSPSAWTDELNAARTRYSSASLTRAQGLSLLAAWGENTIPLLDDTDADRLFDRGGPWDVAAWAVSGYHQDGDHFHAYDSSAWSYPLSTDDAARVWRTLGAIASAGDRAASSPPALVTQDLESTGGRIRLAVALHKLWAQLKEWRKVRTAAATSPARSSSGGGGLGLLLLILAAVGGRSRRRR